MALRGSFYKHTAPTGLKCSVETGFYKHAVPTGLKRYGQTWFYTPIEETPQQKPPLGLRDSVDGTTH